MANNLFIRMLLRALLLVTGVATLRLMPYDQLDNLTIFVLAGIMAVPIAVYHLEYRLFARRAVITQGCTRNGFAERRLWNGSLLKIINYLISLIFAAVIIVVASSLNDKEWLIVLAASVFLIIAEAVTLKFAEKETSDQFLAIFHRGLIKWPVIAFIVIASSALYIDARYPVYVEQDVMYLAERAFKDQVVHFSSPLLGYTRATFSSLDTVTMYFAQNYIPRIEDAAAKWVLWIYLALKSAISMGLIIYLLLGLLTLASIKERRGWKLLGRTVFERYFTLILLLLIAIYLYVVNIDISPSPDQGSQVAGDCTAVITVVQRAQENRMRTLSADEQALSAEVEMDIDDNLNRIFTSAESGVDRYLDWHFSVLGEYQQLGAQLLPTLSKGSQSMLEENVIGGINSQLNQFSEDLDSRILSRINNSSRSAGLQLPGELPYSDCLPTLDFEPLIIERGQVYVGHPQVLVVGSTLTVLIAKKTAAKITAKGAGKVAGKYAGSLGAGFTVAGLCGPFAPICGAFAAVVTWVTVDAVVVTADEIMNREELRQDIISQLESQKIMVRDQMVSLNQGGISASYDIIERSFRIPEDGM